MQRLHYYIRHLSICMFGIRRDPGTSPCGYRGVTVPYVSSYTNQSGTTLTEVDVLANNTYWDAVWYFQLHAFLLFQCYHKLLMPHNSQVWTCNQHAEVPCYCCFSCKGNNHNRVIFCGALTMVGLSAKGFPGPHSSSSQSAPRQALTLQLPTKAGRQRKLPKLRDAP
jgi:hypothetical protein